MKKLCLKGTIRFFISLICLSMIMSIGAQQVLALTDNITEVPYSVNSPGSIFIEGEVIYDDKDGITTNADRFLVQLLDFYNPDPYNPIDEDMTDSNGHYELYTYDEPGAFFICIYTSASYGTDTISVSWLCGGFWQEIYQYLFWKNCCLGMNNIETIDLGEINENLQKAAWIKTYLQESYDYANSYGLNRSFRAGWPDDYGGANMYCMCDEGFEPFCFHGWIYLDEDIYDNPDVVIHETGHAIMDTAYDGDMPYTCPGYIIAGCQDHNLKSVEQPQCAWMEGWATFWSMLVRGDYYYSGTDLENRSWNDEPSWNDGDGVEGRVAGALWDIYDSNDDDYNQYDGGFSTIWDVFCSNISEDFNEFWEAWQQANPDDRFDALQAIYQNTIPYNTYFEIELVEGLNLISPPLLPEEENVTIVFDDLYYDFEILAAYIKPESHFLLWVPGYEPEEGLIWEDGQGYYIDMYNDDTLTFSGHILDPYPAPPPAYDLYKNPNGWNMVGFTSTNENILDEYFEGIEGYLLMIYGIEPGSGDWHPLGGYSGHPYFVPGQGYWFLVSNNCTLYPYGEGGDKSTGMGILDIRNQLMANPNLWDIKLKVNSELSRFTSWITIGIHPEAKNDYDIYLDGPTPPAPPLKELVEAYMWQPENSETWSRKLTIDYSPPGGTVTWPLRVEFKSASGSAQVITISWDKEDVASVPEEYTLLLLDENGKELANMREVTSYSFKGIVPVDADSQITDFIIQALSK